MVHVSSRLRHNCKTDGCLIGRRHEIELWDGIGEAFGRGIHPTDVDGMVEVNGHFLVLEQKGGKSLWDGGKGQGQSLVRLSRYDDMTVVVFVPDFKLEGLFIHYREYTHGRGTEWREVNFKAFKRHLWKWFQHADSQPQATPA